MITIGYTTAPSNTNTSNADIVLIYGPFTSSGPGLITHIKGWFAGDAGNVNMTAGIYTQAAGTYTKIKDTANLVINTTLEIKTFTLDEPIIVNIATNYYIAFNQDGVIKKKYDTPVGAFARYLAGSVYVSGTLPASVTGTTPVANSMVGIYAQGPGAGGGGLSTGLGLSGGNRPPWWHRRKR